MPFKVIPPLYSVWQSMKQRCLNPNFRQYADYGGRGITICDRWLTDYAAFEADMTPRPSPDHSLDRVDPNGDYSPDNCRWATRTEQQRNRRDTRRITVDGMDYVVADLAARFGIKGDIIIDRANRGLPFKDVVSKERFRSAPPKIGATISAERRRNKTHCTAGHEFTPANTLVSKEGWRSCRKCHNTRQIERNRRRRPT